MKNKKKSTIKNKLILASSSQTRIKFLKQYFKDVTVIKHLINEEEYKNTGRPPREIALNLAKKKAFSVDHIYPREMIIGSDQILVCENKIFSKPKTLREAEDNLIFLSNKIHKLLSAIYVIKDSKLFFKEIKTAEIFFKKISIKAIKSYVMNNKTAALSSVGSYKIEDNKKFNFLKIKSGDLETILGFPIESFIEKVCKNE